MKLPGFTKPDGTPRYPGGYPDYIVNHERSPGIGPLAGWRGENGDKFGAGKVNPKQLERYIENGSFHHHHLEPGQRYLKHANKGYLEWAKSVGFVGNYRADRVPALLGDAAEVPPRRARARRVAAAGQPSRRASSATSIRCRSGIAPFEGTMIDEREFPMHAITQRPMHMYHSWGSQNAWLRQITAQNRLFMARERGRQARHRRRRLGVDHLAHRPRANARSS